MLKLLKTKSTKTIIIFFCILTLFCLSTIAYSASEGTMNITGLATSRVEADVRITDFTVHETSQDVISSYEEYAKDSLKTNITLPNNTSTITYKIEITNYGSSNTGIYDISGVNPELNYELIDYSLKEKLCDNSGKCNNYAVKTMYLKISGLKGTYDVNLFLDFQNFYSITYKNIDDTNFATEVIGKETVTINLKDQNIPGVIVKSGEKEYDNYSYNDGILIIKKINTNLIVNSYSFNKNYAYTGSYEVFNVEQTGKYKIELWGASGSNYNDTYQGGKGAYTSGEIILNAGEKLYVYVGQNISPQNYEAAFNGGGAGNYGSDANGIQYGYSGGGATDIRLVAGEWDDFDSLKSRIMVASGGGGAGLSPVSQSTPTYGYDGHGGTLTGINGIGSYTKLNNDSFCGTAGTQTSGGTTTSITDKSNDGSFGIGGYNNGISSTKLGGAGGGGGYYGGAASSRGHGGGGGGSSFISGHEGCNAIKYTSTKTEIIHTDQPIHYSNKYFTNTKMIEGNQLMPSYNSNEEKIGNIGNGYAKIELLEMVKTIDEDVAITGVSLSNTISATSKKETYTENKIVSTISLENENSEIIYDIDITNYGKNNVGILSITGLPDNLDYELLNYNLKDKICDINNKCNNNITKTISIKIKRKNSSEEINNYQLNLELIFKSFYKVEYENIVNVNLINEVFYGETLESNIGLENAKAITIKQNNEQLNDYIYKNGILKVNNVKGNITVKAFEYEKQYNYTGGFEEFNVEYPGIYKIELWGASGSDYNTSYQGGKGAYVSGDIHLKYNEKIFVYVGESKTEKSYDSTFNGGGAGNYGNDANGTQYGFAGGGATDIRLVSGEWNDFESLKSRIMVAAGGGGAGNSTNSYFGYNGHGGTLTGIAGVGNYTYSNHLYCGQGGTQTSGGTTTSITDKSNDGSFGIGGYNNGISSTKLGGAGGGGGYYGGAASSRGHGGGGGGSSFISGHSGCNAISNSSTSSNILHTGSPNHYSEHIFTNTKMIAGNSAMPTFSGNATMNGNDGSGYAKLTLIEMIKE